MADELPPQILAFVAGMISASGPDTLPEIATMTAVMFGAKIPPLPELQRAADRWMAANLTPQGRALLHLVPDDG